MRIYLDVCCLNRPFDDQLQDRVRLETEAITLVLRHVAAGDWIWVGSEVVDFEIEATPNEARRQAVREFTEWMSEMVDVTARIQARAAELIRLGFGETDGMHLACAEACRVDVLLSVDDLFLRRAARLKRRLLVAVENPLKWLEKTRNE